MRFVNAWVAGALGVGAAWLSGQVVPPVVGIAIGAIATVLGMQFVDEWPRYALAGTVYALGFGVAIALVGPGGEYVETPLFALVGFGALSGAIVAVRSFGRRGVSRLAAKAGDEEYTEEVYAAVSAGAGTLSVVWTVIRAQERAAKYGGIAGAGTAGFVLNLLGIEVPIPFWLLEGGLSATMVTFVGSVVAGFHALSTISATWRAAKESAARGKSLGSRAASTATSAAGSASDAVSRTADTAAERRDEAEEKSLVGRAKERLGRDDS